MGRHMNSKTLLSLLIASILAANVSTVLAAVSNKSDVDSVTSWGDWARVQTAAGPSKILRPLVFVRNGIRNAPPSRGNESRAGNPDNSGYRNFASWGGDEKPVLPSLRLPPLKTDYGTSRAKLKYSVDTVEGGQQFNYFPVMGNFTVTNEVGQSVSQGLTIASSEGHQIPYGGELIVYKETVEGSTGLRLVSHLPEKYQSGTWMSNALQGGFFQGVASSLASINAMANTAIAGNGTATYSGNFVRGSQVGKGVNITVNFGQNSSWRGDFYSRLGEFTVENGTINGVDLQGAVNTPGHDGPGFTGVVEASFFGSSAGTIAGIADVAKGETKFVEVFKTDLRVAGND